jgi:hypothetical protein
VGDEDGREAELAAQVLDLLEDLALSDDIERRRRFVHDDEVGAERECHGDHHPLAHAARELVGEAAQSVLAHSDELEQLGCPLALGLALHAGRCASRESVSWVRMSITGLRAFIADWKTMAISSQRKRRSCAWKA